MAAAGVSSPKDMEFEIHDKEIDIVCEEVLCDKEQIELLDSHTESNDTDNQDSTQSHLISVTFDSDTLKSERLLDNICEKTYELNNDSQLVESNKIQGISELRALVDNDAENVCIR